MFWTGTLFLPSEHSQPGMLDGVCIDTLHDAEAACTASSLTDLIGGIRLSDELAPDMGAASSESCFVDLLGKLHIANEPAFDIESVGSTEPMLVDFDVASLDSFPAIMVVIDDPLPPATSDASTSTFTEVLVISHVGASEGAADDPL